MVEPMGSGVIRVSLVDAIHAYSGVTLVVANSNGARRKYTNQLPAPVKATTTGLLYFARANASLVLALALATSLPHHDTNLAYTAFITALALLNAVFVSLDLNHTRSQGFPSMLIS